MLRFEKCRYCILQNIFARHGFLLSAQEYILVKSAALQQHQIITSDGSADSCRSGRVDSNRNPSSRPNQLILVNNSFPSPAEQPVMENSFNIRL